MEIVYVYQKQRRQFGRQTNFEIMPPSTTIDLPSDPTYMQNYNIKNPCHIEVQCAPDMSEHEINTESFVVTNTGIMHREGGWPKDVDSSDVEHTIRYRKKVEKDEDFIRSVAALADIVEHCIKQNNAIDIYEEYFPPEGWFSGSAAAGVGAGSGVSAGAGPGVGGAAAGVGAGGVAAGAIAGGAGVGGPGVGAVAGAIPGASAPVGGVGGALGSSSSANGASASFSVLDTAKATAKTINVFRDPNPISRSVTHLSWHPDDGRKLAVAYSNIEFQKTPSNMPLVSYIWDVENPNTPDMTIQPPTSPLVCLKYNPKDPHILVGGAYSGIVAFWDTRKGSFAVDSSAVEKSHRDPVYSVAWVQSKTGAEFFSASTDGQVLWWDIRKLSEPTESMVLDPEKNGQRVGATILDFETTMPTKFTVGSENGAVYLCNRKSKNPNEKIMHTYTGHHGPITAMQRNPFFVKNFLTVADWTCKIWIEDIRSPIMSTNYHDHYLTDGCWSPSRPSVFFTSKYDGTLDVWDYLFKQNEPTLTVQVGDSPIHCIKVQERGNMIAVGSNDGTTTLLEISEGLYRLQRDEKNTFSQILEREAKREKTLETAAREKRLKAAQKKPGSANPGEYLRASAMQEAIEVAEKDFFSLVNNFNNNSSNSNSNSNGEDNNNNNVVNGAVGGMAI